MVILIINSFLSLFYHHLFFYFLSNQIFFIYFTIFNDNICHNQIEKIQELKGKGKIDLKQVVTADYQKQSDLQQIENFTMNLLQNMTLIFIKEKSIGWKEKSILSKKSYLWTNIDFRKPKTLKPNMSNFLDSTKIQMKT